jgi:uncharacterized protein
MIVSNSSCLIILGRLGKLDLLQNMYGRIAIPGAVEREVFKSKPAPKWIEVFEITQPIAHRILEKDLGGGESEAIILGLELNADLLIVDDLAARRLAQSLGLRKTGTIGILLEAKRLGLIQEIRPILDEMLRKDFRVSTAVYDSALKLAHEK